MEARIHAVASRNAQLLDTIARTEQAVPTFRDQERLIIDLGRDLESSTRRIADLDARRDAELRDHEKYRDSVGRRFLHRAVGRGAAFDERAAREEKEYHDALADSSRERANADSLAHRLSEAEAARDALVADVSRHRAARRELEALQADIFASEERTGRFPAVDDASSRSNAALQAYNDARERIETLHSVAALLASAIAKAPAANKQMELALDHGHLGLLVEANTAVTEAEALVKQARDAEPSLGPVPKVRKTWGNIYGAAYSGDVTTSFMMHDEVRISQRELKRFGEAVEAHKRELEVRAESLGPELRDCEDELERAGAALQEERQKVIAGMIGGEKLTL
ncbi:hypothetical protein B0T11DRAFT_66974 [Plectosphaerella cucumerina]|jgi:tetratricopeptide (TPR) repeat protein|uniref:Uncharacterized protein n=1 Tax=Plectosphaerella cucumerina TaxID=40658 RepID=A0A8K0X883_9PEZI|nr:hypothetical protein B0T11DRAFT_66974 [Plectosphaerella cucumerina]